MSVVVSVIIPTYRGPDTLERAIDSVLGQRGFTSYEIIIVDDNAPESIYRADTERVMEKYRSCLNVKYIKHAENRNGAAARNTGFQNSEGKMICFLDDDDIFMPDKLRLQVAYMNEHPEFGASYTWRFQNLNDIVKCTKTGNLEREMLLLDFFPTTITIMVRREYFEMIHGFDESFRRHQDFEFMLRLFKVCNVGVVCKPLSKIIGKSAGAAGNSLGGKDLNELKQRFLSTFSDTIDRLDAETPGFKKKVYASHYADVFSAYISQREFALARDCFQKNLKLYGGYYFFRIFKHYYSAVQRRLSGNFNSKRMKQG